MRTVNCCLTNKERLELNASCRSWDCKPCNDFKMSQLRKTLEEQPKRIAQLESNLARVTELLKSACGLLIDINQEYQFLTIKEFFKNPEIKEILK